MIFGYLVFIGIASFYLPNSIPSQTKGLQALLNSAQFDRITFHNLRDISTNVLLYMPLGFLLAMYRATFKELVLLTPLLLLGFVVSTSVEITQAFINRTSDIVDIITNTSGYVLGYLIAWIAVNWFQLRPQVILGLSGNSSGNLEQSLSAIRFIYIAVTTVAVLLPLDVSVSLTNIHAKTLSIDGLPPRIIINPLFHFQQPSIDFQYLTLSALTFLPLAFLSCLIQFKRKQTSVLIPALHCLLFATFLEIADIFVKSGRSDILIPILAFGVGLLSAMAANKIIQLSAEEVKAETTASLSANTALITSIIIYLFIILIFSLSPYEFELSLDAIRAKLSDSNFIPLKAHLSHRSLGAAIDLIREPLIYAPWGALLYVLTQRLVEQIPAIIISIGLTGATALFIEAVQLAIVDRFVDITDPLLACGGCILGIVFTQLFLKPISRGGKKEAST